MTRIEQGTYRGLADDLVLEFRVECNGDGRACVVSGDITRVQEFVATFVCAAPQAADDGALTGPVVFRGNPELHTGFMRLDADARGMGSFQLGVDLEGGHRDVLAGRLDWQ